MTRPEESVPAVEALGPHRAEGASIASAIAHRSPWVGHARTLGRDTTAGLVASIVLIANIVSFGALMFPGDLAGLGAPTAIWAMLVGGCIGGTWIALTTSLPPLATGIDSPTGAVLVLLSATVATGMAALGAAPQAVVETVMLVFAAATVLSGALLYGLGACRWGSYLRFVPYFVVAGFLAATGWFLLAGGLRMATGRALSLSGLAAPWALPEVAKLAGAAFTLAVLLALRRWVRSTLALPAALVALWLAAVLILKVLGLSSAEQGWYLPSLGALKAWSPLDAMRTLQVSWPMAAKLAPELVAVAVIVLISLVTKVSSLEVARKTSGDLDRELRGHGAGNLLAAPLGGIASGVATGTSRLLEQAGGSTRISGVACSLVLGAVAVAHVDLPGAIPVPIVAGLVFYLGCTFLADALSKPLAQRAWANVALALGIMVVCIRYGYLVGVIGGVVSACLLFAVSYARIGAVRQHLTRAQFASHVSRSAEASKYLSASGDAIQLYWLSGYLFFGSSEGVFERVRSDMRALGTRRVACVVLDFAMVSGADSSAGVSLMKLRSLCQKEGVALACSSMPPDVRRVLERDGLFAGSGSPVFADLQLALAWCENRLLDQAQLDADARLETFEPWLQQQLGASAPLAEFIAYLERVDVEASQVLYRQGEEADNIDLVAAGRLVIEIATSDGAQPLRVRTVATHTVVGEMGFFRRAARSATVSSDGPATFFTLTRARFERMRRERPDLAGAFDEFLLRVLADRIALAERMMIALNR